MESLAGNPGEFHSESSHIHLFRFVYQALNAHDSINWNCIQYLIGRRFQCLFIDFLKCEYLPVFVNWTINF